MDVSTPEEVAARTAALWESAEREIDRLAEQCCDEFHGELGTFQDFADDRAKWRQFARYLWGLGARPCSQNEKLLRAGRTG